MRRRRTRVGVDDVQDWEEEAMLQGSGARKRFVVARVVASAGLALGLGVAAAVAGGGNSADRV